MTIGKTMLETGENFAILFLIFGAALISIGMGLTIITPKGIPAVLAMLGAFISFLSTIALIILWLLKEFVE
jgi:hypothetical protein